MQNISVRDRLKYKDISWLMPSVNVEDVLVRLGVKSEGRVGKDIRALCPDHYLFVGKKSSDPNWFVNTKTGATMCFTEGRGSNLVWTVCRMFSCSPKEATKFLLGVDSDIDLLNLDILALRHKLSSLKGDVEEEKPEVKGLDAIAQDMNNRYMSGRAYKFFIHPPGKKYPTNIRRETVDRYNVFERTWGYYVNRVVIPFLLHRELVGFCALDLLGKEEWLRSHPLQSEEDYRKLRYPLNFISGNFLFGYDDCRVNCDLLVMTEGAREVMKLWQEGYQDSIAIMGAYLSDNQLLLVSKLNPKRIALMFDGDDAGVAITSRVAKRLSAIYPEERLLKCFPPRGRDPKNLDSQYLANLISRGQKTVDKSFIMV